MAMSAPGLELHLLGTPQIRHGGSTLNLGRKKSVALLAYLATNGKPYTRDTLASLLWPQRNDQQARGNLRRLLSELRKRIGEELLPLEGERVGPLGAELVYVDTREFEGVIGQSKTHRHGPDAVCQSCLDRLQRAVSLYRGDFMIGFSLGECSEFSDWQFFYGEYLRRELEYAYEQLVRMLASLESFDQAIQYAERWLALDPLNEPVHRQLMQLYAATGRRSAALRQYQRCRETLQKELSLPPEEETDRLYQAIKSRQIPAARPTGVRPGTGPPRLAVLPLAGASDEEEWFSEGMTDAITTALSELSGLQVISRTSAYHYRGTGKPMRQIASELEVRYVVEGTVLRSGEEVRVSAQLINGPEDQHLWAGNFVRPFRHIMALQGEVARAIAEQIEVRLTSRERSRLAAAREVDPEVRELCMKGAHYGKQLSPQTDRRALECYQKAFDLDPEYAPACAGLAYSYAFLGGGAPVIPREEAYERARTLARKALDIDEGLPEARLTMGVVNMEWDWDFPGAEQEYRRALATNPNHALTLTFLAQHSFTMGRWNDSLELAERAHSKSSCGDRETGGAVSRIPVHIYAPLQCVSEAWAVLQGDGVH
jgi:DNA-binding SARP family transcriptional activator